MKYIFNSFFKCTFVFVLLTLSKTTKSIVLQCKFENISTVYGYEYSCVAENVRTILNDRNITEVRGNHDQNSSDHSVKRLMIKNQTCPYLPLNIGSFFTNLESLYVMNSKVQHLLKGDLNGLNNLKVFDVSHNPIEKLEADFFTELLSIHTVSFYNCRLKFIDPTALDSLVNLEHATFTKNICIDFQDDDDYIEDLKAEIIKNCSNYTEEFEHDQSEEFQNSTCLTCIHSRNSTSAKTIIILIIIGVVSLLCLVFGVFQISKYRVTLRERWMELDERLIADELDF